MTTDKIIELIAKREDELDKAEEKVEMVTYPRAIIGFLKDLKSLRSEPAKEIDENTSERLLIPMVETSEQVGCKHEDNLEDIPGGVIDRCPKCGRDELCDCEQVTKKIYKIEVPENCDSVTIKKKIEEMIMVMNEMYSLLNYNNPGTNNYQL